MINLIVDTGNTFTKIAVLNGTEAVYEWQGERLTPQTVEELVERFAPSKAIVSSTRADAEACAQMLREHIGYVLCLGKDTPLPIGVDYNRAMLGSDRIAAAVGAVLLQAFARIYCKRRRWNGGEPNRRAIYRWRQTKSLARLLKQAYPETLNELARKATFSQHELLPEELQQYEDYRISLVTLIAEKPWYQRLFFKWILAIA